MSTPLTHIGSRPAAYGPAEWGLTLTLGIIWGSAFLLIAIGVEHLAPGVVAFSRVVLGAIALAAFPMARNRIERADWGRFVLVALVGSAGPAWLFAVAETELDSAVAGMVTSGTPIIALVIASVLLKKLPGKAQAIGIGIGFIGIVMMTAPSLSGTRAAPIGVGLVILATFGYGLNSNLIVPLQQKYGGPTVVLWSLVIASFLLAPLALVGIGESEFTMSAVVAVVILGVIGTGLARVLATTLAGRVGGPRMTTTTYLIPVVAILLGVAFRDEVVQPIAVAGVAVVFLGAYAATRAVRTD